MTLDRHSFVVVVEEDPVMEEKTTVTTFEDSPALVEEKRRFVVNLLKERPDISNDEIQVLAYDTFSCGIRTTVIAETRQLMGITKSRFIEARGGTRAIRTEAARRRAIIQEVIKEEPGANAYRIAWLVWKKSGLFVYEMCRAEVHKHRVLLDERASQQRLERLAKLRQQPQWQSDKKNEKQHEVIKTKPEPSHIMKPPQNGMFKFAKEPLPKKQELDKGEVTVFEPTPLENFITYVKEEMRKHDVTELQITVNGDVEITRKEKFKI